MENIQQFQRQAGNRIAAQLTVVVPALNEEKRISECLVSLVRQGQPIRVMVSNNSSDDQTEKVALSFSDQLDLTIRTIERVGASDHFVSAGRWALNSSDSPLFVILAGDDAWSEGFVTAAMSILGEHPEADVVYPTFVWGAGQTSRVIPPDSYCQRRPLTRQMRALLLPDRRELANLVYGVYRRDAFAWLLSEWNRGGNQFASDYAAAWSVIGRHRVVGCAGAVSHRSLRAGTDLLERVGLRRNDGVGVASDAVLYVRLNIRINLGIGRALRRLESPRWKPGTLQLLLLRAPQWIWSGIHRAKGL